MSVALPAPAVERAGRPLLPLLLLAGALAAPVAVVAPVAAAVLAGGGLVVLLAALRPAAAVTTYVVLAPWLVGLGRGSVVPGLRLNEALLLPVLAGVALATLVALLRGRGLPARHPLDLAVLAAATTSSVTTLLWMYARGEPVTVDDALYAVALWKLALLYAAARLTLRDPAVVRRALVAVVVSATLIGLVGAGQAVGLGPVLDLLAVLVPAEEGGYSQDINRATATIGNPIAYADLMVYAALVAASLAWAGGPGRRVLGALAVVLAFAALASGQASGLLVLLLAAAVFAVVTGTVRQLAAAGAALVAVAAAALQPVLEARLAALEPGTVLPHSWVGRYGRLDNLERFFWPEIGSGWNWLFGVQTSSRVPGPEWWREWVYIESGYTWALWNGGLPLLVAVLALLWLAGRGATGLLRRAEPVDRALGATVLPAVAALGVVMLFDPHLTLRGAADVLFVLLAATATAAGAARPPRDDVDAELRALVAADPAQAGSAPQRSEGLPT